MRPADFNWMSGSIRYWDLEDIPETEDITQRPIALDEDLARIEFPGNIVLDIGWYPGFSNEGKFCIHIIKDENWDKPIIKYECLSVSDLKRNIERLITISEIESNKAH